MINMNLNQIRGKKKRKPKKEVRNEFRCNKNVDKFYDSRQAAINFFIEYTERVSEAKSRSKQ